MKRFQNKYALITGGTSGIGLATAQQFIAEGGTPIITGRSPESVHTAIQQMGNRALGFVSNAGDMKDLLQLQQMVRQFTNNIDLLFVNAGYGKFAAVDQVDELLYDELFNMLVKGVFFTVQQIRPLMISGSSIVLNTSFVTRIGTAKFSIYSAAKSAVQSFIKTFAAECTSSGIRVNGISPGHIKTNIFNNTGLAPGQIKQALESIIPSIPLKRQGEPGEVAQAVLFLSSAAASYIHGAELSVDGGISVIA